jgi:hypothetical protein
MMFFAKVISGGGQASGDGPLRVNSRGGDRMDRREFFKKAGLGGGLGAAGALTLKKEYVKPVVRLLEPNAAYAQTPGIVVMSSAYTVSPMNMSLGQNQTQLNLVLDIPGGGPPAPNQFFNASVSVQNVFDASGWQPGTGPNPGATITSNVIDNAAISSSTSQVSFGLNLGVAVPPPAPSLNGFPIPGPTVLNEVTTAITAFVAGGVPGFGDTATFCINVDADAGVTTTLTGYPAQTVGSFCVTAQFV